jgi:TolB protein
MRVSRFLVRRPRRVPPPCGCRHAAVPMASAAAAWAFALVLAVAATVAAALVPTGPLAAQERPQGVSLTLEYEAGRRIALMVLPIRGAAGDSIKTILERDLDFSDRFQHVPATAAPDFGAPLNYGLLARAGAAGVVQAQLLPSGWLRVLLHDVAGKAVRQQGDFPLPAAVNTDAWRLGVHAVSDAVEEWITGQRGIAATRIAFVRDGRVWVVDSDGANARAVTPRGLSPSWHPSGRYLAYHVLEEDRHRLAVTDLVTGAQRSLTNVHGALDNTPAIAPDGQAVAFTRSVEATAGQSDLYVMPFEGGRAQRVSVSRGSINTAPSWSPDGRRLVFSSDRSGRNEIYISDADGTNVSLLTADAFGERNLRADPSWSPDGRLVAYSSLVGGRRQILTINLRDRAVSQVTSEGQNNTPAWAPDARHLVFASTRSGTEQLWVVDVESGRSRQLTRGAGARLAEWSPRLTVTP